MRYALGGVHVVAVVGDTEQTVTEMGQVGFWGLVVMDGL